MPTEIDTRDVTVKRVGDTLVLEIADEYRITLNAKAVARLAGSKEAELREKLEKAERILGNVEKLAEHHKTSEWSHRAMAEQARNFAAKLERILDDPQPFVFPDGRHFVVTGYRSGPNRGMKYEFFKYGDGTWRDQSGTRYTEELINEHFEDLETVDLSKADA